MNETECKPEPVIPTEEEQLDQLKRSCNFHKVRCCTNCAFREVEETELGGIGHTYCGKEYNNNSMGDFVAIITSFCSRLYGLRRNKRRTEKLIAELSNKDN